MSEVKSLTFCGILTTDASDLIVNDSFAILLFKACAVDELSCESRVCKWPNVAAPILWLLCIGMFSISLICECLSERREYLLVSYTCGTFGSGTLELLNGCTRDAVIAEPVGASLGLIKRFRFY